VMKRATQQLRRNAADKISIDESPIASTIVAA
jgi:hypothetical protein